MRRQLLVFFLSILLVSCGTETNYAPVSDISGFDRIPKSGIYHVSWNETLYSIAWRYGLDYRYLARLNHLQPPYHIVAGSALFLTRNKSQIHHEYNHSFKKQIPYVPEINFPVKSWYWPAQGRVVKFYSLLNKGINIVNKLGSPVFATSAGQVVYSGNGLRGYGNLIIIRHNNNYLSAYANNSSVLVKEGQFVQYGQKIAQMGSVLHFEIRRNGLPVNPLNYLK